MITRIALLAAASAAVSACGQTAEDSTSNQIVNVGGNSANANATASTAPVALPPAIKNTVKYRCTGDNSVIEASFLVDDVTVNVRPGDQPTASPTQLKAAAPGQPFEAEGYSLSGSGATVTYKSPTGGSQTCRSGPAS